MCVYLNSWSWSTCGCIDGLDLCVGIYSSWPWSVSSGICIDGPVLVAGVSALNVFPEPHLPSGSAETYVTTQVTMTIMENLKRRILSMKITLLVFLLMVVVVMILKYRYG